VLSEELGGKKSVKLIAKQKLEAELQNRPDKTTKRLLWVPSFLYFKTSAD
jgi:hypothetical protein